MEPLERVDNVVITGASAGVGRATAAAFGSLGCNVGLIARGLDGLRGARADVESAGGQALILQTDVADAEAVEDAAARFERDAGPIDVWVNSAMATVYAPLSDVTADEFRRVTEVTYLGQVYGTMAALRRMRPRDRGTIVNVSSALAYHGLPLQAAYCGAKFAVRGFTESVRSELLHDGSQVRLSMVVLPAINTPQFEWARNKLRCRPQPVPPVYDPEVAADAILRAAEEAPREILVGKSSLQLLLGAMAAPGYIDHRLADMGYAGQQSDEPDRPGRTDNLFAPVPGDFGARGRFGAQAMAQALQANGETFRRSLVAAAVALPALASVIGYALARRNGR